MACDGAKALVCALRAVAADEVARRRVGCDPAKDDAAEQRGAAEPVRTVDATGDLARGEESRLFGRGGGTGRCEGGRWEVIGRWGRRPESDRRTIGFWSLSRTRD